VPVTHVVLVSFSPQVAQATREGTLATLQQLGGKCGGRDAGILYWNAGWNLDQRKNHHLMLVAIFSSEDALLEYAGHPAHKEFTRTLSEIADWVTGDLAMGGGNTPLSWG
jgi:hypothetical protein